MVHRWLVANTEGDADAVMARISEQPGVLAVGSDDEEWLHAAERAERAVWRQQIEESGGFPLAWDEIEAWEEGSVGWAATRMTIRPLDGSGDTSHLRATYVLHLERGEWKLVQVHWSLGRSNVDVLGVELATSVEHVQKAIQRDRPDLLRNRGRRRHDDTRLHGHRGLDRTDSEAR